MALQVWLPLISDVHDQGLGGLNFTNNGDVTFDGSGKLGSSAEFSGSNYIESTEDFGEGITTWTMSCWVKPDSRDLTSGQWYRIGGIGNHTRVHLDFSSTNRFRIFLSLDGTTSTTVVFTYSTTVAEADKWYHICGTVSANKVDIYINGVLEASSAISSSYTSTLGGKVRVGSVNNGNKFSGLIQDFRIYDNALSAKEVQLLSRGLVLHYPLAQPGGENLVVATHTMDTDSFNHIGSNVTTDETESNLCGYTVKKIIGTTAGWNQTQVSPSVIPYSTVKDKTITISFEAKADKSDASLYCGIGRCTSSSLDRIRWRNIKYEPLNTAWSRHEVSATINDAFFTSGTGTMSDTDRIFVQFYLHQDDTTAWIRHIKFEIGDHATPWCPNSADDEYTALGFNDGIEYDVSGFGYNGARYGNITCSTNTPRYNTCYEFDTTSYVKLDQALYPIFRMGRDETTISIWAYKDDWTDYTQTDGSTSQRYTMFSCQEGGGWATYIRGTGVITFQFNAGESSHYIGKNSTLSAGALSAGWHMFTTTYDGFTLRGYIDGVLRTTETAAYTEKTPVFYNTGTACIYIGVESGSGAHDNLWWNGKLSDFRVYETALSSTDILELYQTGASLASNGTLMTSEYVESI